MAYMRERTNWDARKFLLRAAIAAGIFVSLGLAGCGSPKPAEQAASQPPAGPQRYKLSGRVVSIEAPKQQVTVDAGDIPGFMAAMTMGYSVKDPSVLAPLSAEDQITADVVVNGRDVYLENIVVTKKADKAKAPAAGGSAPASGTPAKQQ
jgi:Cu/Ag efflux protein CusF